MRALYRTLAPSATAFQFILLFARSRSERSTCYACTAELDRPRPTLSSQSGAAAGLQRSTRVAPYAQSCWLHTLSGQSGEAPPRMRTEAHPAGCVCALSAPIRHDACRHPCFHVLCSTYTASSVLAAPPARVSARRHVCGVCSEARVSRLGRRDDDSMCSPRMATARTDIIIQIAKFAD